VQRGGDGRVSEFRPQRVRLAYACGIESRDYDSATKIVKRSSVSKIQGSTPRIGISYSDALGFLFGGGTAFSLLTAAKDARVTLAKASIAEVPIGRKILFASEAILLAGAGFGIGYGLGFDDQVKCGDQLYRQLLDDPTFWDGVHQEVAEDHHWKIIYSDQIPPLSMMERLKVERERPRWIRINAYLLDLRLEQEEIAKGIKFMRIQPFADRKIEIQDLFKDAREAGVLPTIRSSTPNQPQFRLSPMDGLLSH
jgi:hypothetical protein